MLVRFFLSVLAIFFPWTILLIYDNPTGALMTLVLQATIIGWIPASCWAWRLVHPKKKSRLKQEQEEEEQN